LASLATRGGGPEYRRFGKRVVYRMADLLAWAQTRDEIAPTSVDESDKKSPGPFAAATGQLKQSDGDIHQTGTGAQARAC
jgi:hypothetical protein